MPRAAVLPSKASQAITFENFYLQTSDVAKVKRLMSSMEDLGVEPYRLTYTGYARNPLGGIEKYENLEVNTVGETKFYPANFADSASLVPVKQRVRASRNTAHEMVAPKWKLTMACNSNFGVL